MSLFYREYEYDNNPVFPAYRSKQRMVMLMTIILTFVCCPCAFSVLFRCFELFLFAQLSSLDTCHTELQHCG
jgi:hypothetical protein